MQLRTQLNFKRAGGILLHPTSLPGPFGIGDLGPVCIDWLDWLKNSGCSLWQFLPLGPTGYADSPYQCLSAFAGNPLLISPQVLLQDGLLDSDDLVPNPHFDPSYVDYGRVIELKIPLLQKAAQRFLQDAGNQKKAAFERFCRNQQFWLDDFALFIVLKTEHGLAPWHTWEKSLALRDPETLSNAWSSLQSEVRIQQVIQYFFFQQWRGVRSRAEELGITLIGDLPIFVAHDSAEVWAHPEMFLLQEDGQPEYVAGVPPDYFSPTGQRWGNPLYRWDYMREFGYRWWTKRLKAALEIAHTVRLDHFRGFEAYWEIPASEETAVIGRWVKGPGKELLLKLQENLGGLPIIAEDLGLITPEVIKLRDSFSLPGMKVLQFAFDADDTHPFLPLNYSQNCVAYTGTHDNDTVRGWYEAAPEEEKDFARRYLRVSGEDIAWDMIRAVWHSRAVWALAPMQDFLALHTSARMNYPGRMEGNWSWRLREDQITTDLQSKIAALSKESGRTES
ncbi:MAG: 4-alpha-glucanotransferase [Anaerolineales bacterium]|nr:4-alpha-glucanotransferase [Anaerolineales bacterium]